MPSLNPVSANTSSPIPPVRTNIEKIRILKDYEYQEENDQSHLKNQKIRKSSDNILSNLSRPTKRITSCASLSNLSEPLFKNIKHYKSKKLRCSSSSTTVSSSSSSSSPTINKKRLDSIITTGIPINNSRSSSSGLFSLPSTPLKNPGLSFEDTPNTDYSPITPTRDYFSNLQESNGDDHVARQLFRSESQSTDDELGGQIGQLCLNSESSHRIFKIPEIVNLILEIFDSQNSYIPREEPPIRRVPLSYEHALLIHKDEQVANRVWKESREMIGKGTYCNSRSKHALHNCLTVNKLWYQLSMDIMMKNCYFDDESDWLKYASVINKKLKENKIIKPMSSTQAFVLHKLTHVKQRHFDLVTNVNNYNHLKWLELYIVPNVLPNPKMFTSNLKKLVITGSKVLDDKFLISISNKLSNIEVLDLRACELITDTGIYSISMNCPKLKLLNVGRYTRGDLVSDASICPIIRNTQISTLGVAGCGISDRTIWELAIHRSHVLERLSLNKCWKLTNESIPKTIKFFKKLSVLELRHCLQIDNVKPMIEYKRYQMSKKINVLIEGCEAIERLILKEEVLMDTEISKKILEDIVEWCNSTSDAE